MLSPTNRRKSQSGRGLVTLILLVAWIAGLGLVALNRQNILDWWKLREYQAPTAVSALATQDTMTDYGRKIFYVNQPSIKEKSAFASVCPNDGGEQTIVLGCYRGNQNGIFLLTVTDPRLNGVQQVTAAHEMLHGAYDRLSSADRKKVDAMLNDYYQHDLHDERIQATIEAYKKSEPNDVVNEMHSVFGSEIAQLPSGLEQYYKRYFNNRAQVAAYGAQYQAEFTSRQAKIDAYKLQLDKLKDQIDAAEADLSNKQQDINTRESRLNSLRNSGDTQAYNASVPGFNSLVVAYNSELQSLQGTVDQYNQLVSGYNAVALEEDQLVKDLSSKAAPIQQ